MTRDNYHKLSLDASSAPLSRLIPELLIHAKEVGKEEIAKWATLELGGYFQGNPALTPDVIVPEYRAVAGQYSDRNGRPLVITDARLAFISEYRLRYSVAELEKMENHSGLLAIEDPTFTEMIRKNFNVEVHQFCFGPSSVSGVLSGIRARLILLLGELKPESAPVESLKPRMASDRKRWWDRTPINKENVLDRFHPIVVRTASSLYQGGHYRQAILDTYIALVQRVKELSGRADLDNTGLMQTVFSPKNPIIILSNDPDEQMGYMWMFSGAVMGVRNPRAHNLDALSDPLHAFEWLAFSSVLFRLLDSAKVQGK